MQLPPRRSLRLVVPRQEQISGGRVFNTELRRALHRRGWEIEELRIAGAWPWPTEDDRERVGAALGAPAGQVVLIDGLVGSACPRQIATTAGSGVHVVVIVHLPLPAETGRTPEQQAHLHRLESNALHAATEVVTTSHWTAADLERRYGLRRVRVLGPGAPTAPLAAGSDPPMLLMVGAITPVKNHATVLAALATIGDLPWQAGLIGAHRDEDTVVEVRRLVRTPPHADRITLPGELIGAALDRAWDGANLLLLPSWTETYGLVVTEALARGIPAVVSRGTGAVEALTGAPAADQFAPGDLPGALADPGDPQQWADILRDWLTNPTRRDSWRQCALRRRAELRTWADTATELENLLGGLP